VFEEFSLRRWLPTGHALAGLALVILAEAMIFARLRPWTDFYFPIVWLGYVMLLDGALERTLGYSLIRRERRLFLAMLPMSAVFWWVFEAFNVAVQNWRYVGSEPYTGLGYVTFATACFAFVLLAVWLSAWAVDTLLPRRAPKTDGGSPPLWFLRLSVVMGMAALALPILFPHYAFGLIWGCLFLLLDPINFWLDRPSIYASIWRGDWRVVWCFGLAGLMCGFFWESWNFWAVPKWVYSIPYVGFWHVYEMPLLGWLGYPPFGLELFAMTNFALPWLGFKPLGLLSEGVTEADQLPRAAG
jgi:hypothetical protein